MKKTITLAPGERIIAAVPESCIGPGWSNAVVWVYIAKDDVLRQECIQPAERTPDMHALFDIGETVCNALLAAVPVDAPRKRHNA